MISPTSVKWIAGGVIVASATLLWPGPAGATSKLGGYTASVDASVVHIELYEPVIPVPASPQGELSIGYAQATAQSGTTRALASYLWPGSVVGDGFDQITNQPGSTYPVQVNSRYPATQQAPKSNHAQLTKGNGMQTYADPDQARATTSGLGIHAPDTNPLDGAGSGLGQLVSNEPAPGGGSNPLPLPSSLPVPTTAPSGLPKAPKPPKSPVPVPAPLAALATVHGMTSTANIDARGSRVISSALATAKEVDLLAGMITLKDVTVDTRIISNGKHATNVGGVTIAAMSIAGHPIALGKHGLEITGQKAPAPDVPAQLTSGLKQLGISFSISPAKQSTKGPSGTFTGQGMTVTVDTAVLRKKLDSPVNTLAKSLPSDLSTQLAPLFALRPKLVFKIGETRNSATSAPPFVIPPITPPVTHHGGGAVPPPATGGGGGSTGGLGGVTGTGSSTTGGTTTGTTTTGTGGTATGGTSGGGGGTVTPTAQQPAALSLPALGTMPRLFILGGLVLAAGLGWALQTAGGSLLGGTSSCAYGLRKGVPNLRKPNG